VWGVDDSWADYDPVGWCGVNVHPDAVPLLDGFCGELVEHEVVGSDGCVSVLLVAGVGKSAGFPIRETKRVCKSWGVTWGYPEDPQVFTVSVSRDVAMLRHQAVQAVPPLRRTLSRGDYGHDVMLAQEALARLGWEGVPSARFTNDFMRAVRVYQGEHGMRVSGVIDRVSWTRLMEETGVYSDS
jgi:hypothetical protein